MDIAQGASLRCTRQGVARAAIAVLVVDADPDPCGIGKQLASLLQGTGDGLLDQHVLSSLRSGPDHLVVQSVWYGEVDGIIGVSAIQHLIVVGGNLWDAVAPGEALRTVKVRVAASSQSYLRDKPCDQRREPGDVAATHDGEAEPLHDATQVSPRVRISRTVGCLREAVVCPGTEWQTLPWP